MNTLVSAFIVSRLCSLWQKLRREMMGPNGKPDAALLIAKHEPIPATTPCRGSITFRLPITLSLR
jgi:hypothetical protein